MTLNCYQFPVRGQAESSLDLNNGHQLEIKEDTTGEPCVSLWEINLRTDLQEIQIPGLNLGLERWLKGSSITVAKANIHTIQQWLYRSQVYNTSSAAAAIQGNNTAVHYHSWSDAYSYSLKLNTKQVR